MNFLIMSVSVITYIFKVQINVPFVRPVYTGIYKHECYGSLKFTNYTIYKNKHLKKWKFISNENYSIFVNSQTK